MCKRVVSGIRPTGYIHIGHYYGVLCNWVNLQYKNDCFFFIADWHALTARINMNIIFNISKKMLIEWLSVGLNPNVCTIFIQSKIKQIPELYLMLSMITSLNYLESMPSYKCNTNLITYGLLGYPLLQCADILGYRAQLVPVGKDQVIHIELTKKIIKKINLINKNSIKHFLKLPLPKSLLNDFPSILGTDGRKMSKSYNNTIYLVENYRFLNFKINKIITNIKRKYKVNKGNPFRCIIWNLHTTCNLNRTKHWIQYGCTNAKLGCISCKKSLVSQILKTQALYIKNAILYNKVGKILESILTTGEHRATKEIKKTLKCINVDKEINSQT